MTDSDSEIGRWWIRLRPAGPAGLLEARLPVGITIHTDRAQPDLPLQLIVRRDVGNLDLGVLELAAVLFGPASRVAWLRSGSEPEGEPARTAVAYEPDDSPLRRGLLALVSLIGDLDQRPALAALDVCAAANDLAADAPDALAALMTATATAYAAATVAALRVLPVAGELRLDAAEVLVLQRAAQLASELLGVDVDLGAAAASAPAAALDDADADADVRTGIGIDDELLALLGRERELAESTTARGRPRDDGVVAVSDNAIDDRLAMLLEDVVIASESPPRHTVRGKAVLIENVDGELTVRRDAVVPDDGWPPIWVRAISTNEPVVLYQSRCGFTGSNFSAELSVWGEYLTDFVLDITSDPASRPLDPRRKAGEQARRLGAKAMQDQRRATDPAEWASIANDWRECARRYRAAGDPARRVLALLHAQRAYAAAGPHHANALAETRTSALAAIGRLDPGWLAPDPDEAATADPLKLAPLLISAALTRELTEWAIREIRQLVAPATPDESTLQALARRLTDLARAGDPADHGLRAARAHARVQLAIAAIEAESHALAHLLALPNAIEYAYLDAEGRVQFARLCRLLVAEPSDGPLLSR